MKAGARRSGWRLRLWLTTLMIVAAATVPAPPSGAATVSPGWIVVCQYSHTAPNDPVVFPRQPGASHLHDFVGNTSIDADSTYSSMVGGTSRCAEPLDRAGYWIPTLYKDGVQVIPGGTGPFGRSTRQRFYYRKDTAGSVAPFPAGFTMIIGNAYATSEADNAWLGPRINWGCADNDNPSNAKAPVDCPTTGIITLHFDFPTCWDGTYTPLVNEGPEMRYPINKLCPAGWVRLPRLIERFEWPVGTTSGGITLASGPYYTAHADFVNTWRQDRLEQLTAACLNANVDCKALPGVAPPPPSNTPPVARDDAWTVAEDDPPSPVDVLANDSDADGDALLVTLVSDPAHGSATLDAGTPSYRPDPDFAGTDAFTYWVRDAHGATVTATATMTVSPVPDPPQPGDDAVWTAPGVRVDIDVLANDRDPDGDPLAIDQVGDPPAGSAWVDDRGTPDPGDDRVSYVPDDGFVGTDTFTYAVTDGVSSVAATITVHVATASIPATAVDDDDAILEDTVDHAIDVLHNDVDPDGPAIALASVGTPSHGTARVDDAGTPTDRTDDVVRYTPSPNFHGTDAFTYAIDDGEGGTSSATVRVTVAPTEDPPDAVDDAATTTQDSPATFVDVLANDSDPDGDPLTVVGVTDPPSGAATIRSAGDGVTYQPDPGFSGTDTFGYTISDGNGNTDSAAVTITVVHVNRPPIAAADAVTLAEDEAAIAVDVLGNDADPDGDPIRISAVSTPAHGSAVIDGNGTPSNPADDVVRYTPLANYAGTDAFTYSIVDPSGSSATATVSVTVTPVNDPPDALDDAATVMAGTATTIAVLANDTTFPDAGETLAIAAISTPAHGSAVVDPGGTTTTADDGIRYTSSAGYVGSDAFTYTVSDGNGGSDTATVRITVVSPTTNLVGNPGFETSLAGWVPGGTKVVLERVAGGNAGSGWAARVRNSGTSSVTMKIDDDPNWVSTTATGTYTASLFARAQVAGATLTLKIREYAGSKRVGQKGVTLRLTTAWQPVSMTYVAVQPGTSKLDLTAYASGGAGASFDVDDVSITRS